MKKITFYLIAFLLMALKIDAQDKKITDLNFLYVDEKFDKLVDKSVSLILNNTYKRHPMPYMYA
ncbi:MAG: hypothetical protein GW818_01840, partial [Flavobacteriales bacterium]|nr:hypothetical protein [Flavobacteriales bacterium]